MYFCKEFTKEAATHMLFFFVGDDKWGALNWAPITGNLEELDSPRAGETGPKAPLRPSCYCHTHYTASSSSLWINTQVASYAQSLRSQPWLQLHMHTMH